MAAFHVTSNDAKATVAKRLRLKPKYKSVAQEHKKQIDSVDKKCEKRHGSLYTIGKAALSSGGWGIAYGIGASFGPAGIAVVGAASFAKSAYGLYASFKAEREAAKVKGQKLSFWQYMKANPKRVASTCLSAATACLGGLGAAQVFANPAVLSIAQTAVRGSGLLLGASNVIDAYRKAPEGKKWKTAAVAGASFVVGMVTGRVAGHYAGEIISDYQASNLDNGSGASTVSTMETNQQITKDENVVNTSLQTRADHIEHDKGPEFGVERQEVVSESSYEQANEIQLNRLFDANPRAVNEILGGEWKNSDELHNMMKNGEFNSEQLEAIHAAARANIDENGHIISENLKEEYVADESTPAKVVQIQTETVEVGKTIQINVGSNGDGVYEVVGKEGFNTQVERGYHSEANGSKFDVVKVVYTNDATGEKEVVYVGPEGPMSKETFDSQGRALECFDIKSGEEVLIHKTEYDDSNNTVTRTSYEGENVTRIVKQENTDTAEINYRDNDGDGKTDVTASYSKIDNTATFETETSKVIINDDMNEIKVIRDGKIYVNKLDDSATFEQRNEWYDMTKNLSKNPDAKLSEGFSEVPNEVQDLLDVAKEKSEETGEPMDIAGAIRQKAYEDEVAKFNIFEEKTDLVDIMEEAYENVVKSKPYLNENTGLIEMVESGKVFVGIDGDGDGQADSFIPKDKDGCTTKIEYEHDEDGGNLQKATITHTNAETGEKEVIVLSKEGTRTTCYDGEGHRTSYIEKNSEQTTTSKYEGDKLVSVEKDDNTGKTVDKYEEGKLVSRHVESKVSGEIQDQKFDESGEITSLEIIRGDICIDKRYEDGNVISETETDMKTGVEITKIYEEGEVREISEYDPNKGVIIGTKGDTKTETYLNENKTLNYEKNGEEYKLVSTITKDGVEEITTYHNHNDMQVTEENGHIKQVVYGNSTAYADGKGNIYKVEIQHVDGGKTVIEQNGTPRFFNDEGHVILNANNHINFRGVTGSYLESQGMSCNNADETPFKPGTSIKNVVDNIVIPRDVSQSTSRTSYSHGTAYKGMA